MENMKIRIWAIGPFHTVMHDAVEAGFKRSEVQLVSHVIQLAGLRDVNIVVYKGWDNMANLRTQIELCNMTVHESFKAAFNFMNVATLRATSET